MGFDIVSYLMGKSGGGGGGSYPWFGPGTELVDTKQEIINLADDTSWASWTPSTTAGTILAAPSAYQYEWSVDLEQYDYYIISSFVTDVALKNTATLQKVPIRIGRINIQEVYGVPNSYNTWESAERKKHKNLSQYVMLMSYYNLSGVMDVNDGSLYGPEFTSQNPSVSPTWPNTIKWKRSDIIAQCNTTYFYTDRAVDIDADNTNMTIDIELYRTPIAGSLMAVEIDKLRRAIFA